MLQFNALLKQSELAAFSQQAKIKSQAQTLWQAIAPREVIEFSHASSIKNKVLIIYADNNTVAAKLKLLMSSLLIQLEKQGSEVTAIHIKVQVKSSPQAKAKTLKTLSHKAASNVDNLAKQLEGTPLGASLAKLASRTK